MGGTGDYICVTLRGGAPWGFSVRQVQEGGAAFRAGVRDGDQVVSLNGEPCGELQLPEARYLINTSTDCLQLLLKRYGSSPTGSIDPGHEEYEEEEEEEEEEEDEEEVAALHGETSSPRVTLESTTLHIVSSDRPHPGSATPRELRISELRGDGSPYYAVEVRDREPEGEGDGDEASGWQERSCFSPGGGAAAVVELRLSLPSDECTSLGSALGIEGLTSSTRADGDPRPRPPEDAPATHTSTHSLYVPGPLREPLGQRGVVLGCPLPANAASSLLGQVEFTLQHPGGGGAGVSGSVGSPGKAGDGGGGGHSEGDPASFSVSFGVPKEEEVTAAAEEEERDCDSEGDPQEPNKHRARHAKVLPRLMDASMCIPSGPDTRSSQSWDLNRAKNATATATTTTSSEDRACEEEYLKIGLVRGMEVRGLRRSESQSEKQVKEAKSKCKRIALLLSAAPSNPNNKGLLMFKKHRQRAKKYTLVSYGTGESEPESDGDDDTVEFTLLATSDSDLDKHFFTDAQSGKGVLTINWDKGLLEIERSLNNPEEMECLPDTKGKGAMMFAQRRLRMDEIAAEHEEMRRQGIPVEGLQETETKAAYQQMEERSQDMNGQGEEIASRDERISTPAIRTGVLQDTRRRVTGKPMFTFKDAPKVSPNPVLLNLLNRSDKKGFESGPEEDYLSLGAEACNFLQSTRVKPKLPPPVAPKPVISPASLPWTQLIEGTNQDQPELAENSVATPAVAPTVETAPAAELEPTPAPAAEPSPPPTHQEAPAANIPTEQQQQQQHTWSVPEPQAQPQPQPQQHRYKHRHRHRHRHRHQYQNQLLHQYQHSNPQLRVPGARLKYNRRSQLQASPSHSFLG
ncbi:hypothetical protein CRUP_025063 [Coryphaenoides rupestris]|nr:hypothetical protein CRUP_025063 [Coryphaenoides rupestris]